MKSMRQILKEIRDLKQPEFMLRPPFVGKRKYSVSGEEVSAEIWRRNQTAIGKQRIFERLNKEFDYIVSLMQSAFTQELKLNYSRHPIGGAYFFRGIPNLDIEIFYLSIDRWQVKIAVNTEYEELGKTTKAILRFQKIDDLGDHTSFNINIYYRLKKLIEQFHNSGLFRDIQIYGFGSGGDGEQTKTLEDNIKQLTLLFLPFLEQHYGKNIKPEVLSGIKKQRDFGF